MIWNPFDWTAGPFLTFYATMATIVFLTGFSSRMRIGPPAPAIPQLSALELAYLSGGPHRVADVALLWLMSVGAAMIGSKDYVITVTAPLGTVLGWPIHLPVCSPMTRRRFQTMVTPLVGRVQSRLQELGYCPTDEQVRSLHMTIVPFILLLLGVGVIKAVVDAGRHQPIGILVCFLILTVFLVIALAQRPRRTRAGTDALEDYQTSHARASRAPREHEHVLAVALSGPVILLGTPYASVYFASNPRRRDSGDGGCGGCGGCD